MNVCNAGQRWHQHIQQVLLRYDTESVQHSCNVLAAPDNPLRVSCTRPQSDVCMSLSQCVAYGDQIPQMMLSVVYETLCCPLWLYMLQAKQVAVCSKLSDVNISRLYDSAKGTVLYRAPSSYPMDLQLHSTFERK